MRYLLTTNIPFYADPSGRVWTDALWVKDLAEHLKCVDRLLVVAPLSEGERPGDWVEVRNVVTGAGGTGIEFCGVKSFSSFVSALLGYGVLKRQISEAIDRADVVQLNVAGWPVPLGWIAKSLAMKRGKRLVVVVESAPWRGERGWKGMVRSRLFELMARRCVAASDVCFFTHAGYRDSLLPKGFDAKRAHVVHATWIDECHMLTGQGKGARAAGGQLRVLFAGRLVEAKGLRVVLDAVERLSTPVSVRLSVMGSGELEEECRAFAARWSDRVELVGTVEYGKPFMDVLDRHDVLVVPTLSDEQPRVVYDAYARGLPVIASDTQGHRDCVFPGETGWLVGRGDAGALARELERLARAPKEVEERSAGALSHAQNKTHTAMHTARHRLVVEGVGMSEMPVK